MTAHPTDLKRRFALFDEVADLPLAQRAAWFLELQVREPEHASAVLALLDELEQSVAHPQQPPSLGGVSVRAFEAQVDAAAAPDAGPSVGAGDAVGPWRLERKIGEGGMGAVWLAARHDGHFEGHAAIKFLRTGLGKTELVDRFLRERRLLARLAHPGIARLLDAGTHLAEPYLVMEYIDGLPITDWAGRNAPQLAQRIALLLKVYRATEYAHGQLIVHRDIKPSNVMVSLSGEPALLDFGIAKLMDDVDPGAATALTHMTGRGFTLGYCAPEQVTGDATGVAADVFSLGVLAFELVTGVMPFAGDNRAALEHAIVHTEAKSIARALQGPPTSPAGRPADAARAQGDLDAIVAKALRKNPADRYTTVGAFAADLERWMHSLPVDARRGNWHYKTRLWLRRNRLVAVLASVAFLAVSTGMVVALWQAERASAEAKRATKVADYLGELIQSASPDNHSGKWPSVLTLLEQSEKDLGKQFADDPKTHALLLERLADTNDALNRDQVALAQLQQLHALLVQTGPANSDAALSAQKHTAQLLRRLRRYPEALAIDEQLLPQFARRYGTQSEAYGRLVQGHSSNLIGVGRMQEAKERMKEGAAIMSRLFPNNLPLRLDDVNDLAILLTKQGLWKEALDTLRTVEADLPALANMGGQHVRTALIMRANLESMRIRLGHYEGTQGRMEKVIAELDTLMGKDNPLAVKFTDRLQSLVCETGRFADCRAINAALLGRFKVKAAPVPAVLGAELNLLDIDIRRGITSTPTAKAQLERMLDTAPRALPVGAERADFYRRVSDAAASMGLLDMADTAQRLALADLAQINNANPEQVVQVRRSAALTAYLRGDPQKAVQLLQDRFALYEKSQEGDSPRRATLWLQRALYEVEFDAVAAAQSVLQSKSIFGRLGGPPPQWKAVLTYLDLRLNTGNTSPAALRAAEDAVDLAFMRPRSATWRAPTMASL
ncbi:MAG: serine/threonine-protein kinase [Pseudomonadota bacterium]